MSVWGHQTSPAQSQDRRGSDSGVIVSGHPKIASLACDNQGLSQGRENSFVFRKGNTPLGSEDNPITLVVSFWFFVSSWKVVAGFSSLGTVLGYNWIVQKRLSLPFRFFLTLVEGGWVSVWAAFALFLTSWLLLMKRLLQFVWLLDLRYSAVVLLLVKVESNCSLSSFNAARWQEAGFYLFFSLKWHSWASRRKSFILTRNFA